MYRVEKLSFDNIRTAEQKLNELEAEGFKLIPESMIKESSVCVAVFYKPDDAAEKKAEKVKEKPKEKKEQKAEVSEDVSLDDWDSYVA